MACILANVSSQMPRVTYTKDFISQNSVSSSAECEHFKNPVFLLSLTTKSLLQNKFCFSLLSHFKFRNVYSVSQKEKEAPSRCFGKEDGAEPG